MNYKTEMTKDEYVTSISELLQKITNTQWLRRIYISVRDCAEECEKGGVTDK